MKKILLRAFIIIGLLSPSLAKSQTFSVQADTVYATVSGSASIFDTIVNRTDSTITLNWHVINSDFPGDWRTASALGICDANLCRPNASGALWNGSGGSTYSCAYPVNTHLFDIALNLDGASAGTHWMTIAINHPSSSYTKNVTFVINKFPTAVANVNAGDNDITMYPNPAREELNVLFNANADVRNIAVYNIIGKVMMVYKVTGASANLNLENIPAGVYFVRLTNSRGEMVTTKKFTKQ